MTKRAVPSDLHILNAPLPKLPHLGILAVLPDAEQSTAVVAFADHVRKMLRAL
jgi:hypothetical protein